MQLGSLRAVNRRHPDATGCAIALPFAERGGVTVRDLLSQGKGAGAFTGTGGLLDADWARHARGWGISTDGAGKGVQQANTRSVSRGDGVSICATVMFNALPGSNFVPLVQVDGGGLFADSTAPPNIGYTGATQIMATPDTAIVVGATLVLGLRWRFSVASSVDVWINGRKYASLAGTPRAALVWQAKVAATSTEGFAPKFQGVISDVRIWDRYMPDPTFRRYYTNPGAFYAPRRSAVKGTSFFQGGRFLPFLHPQWGN